jgi:hypothetical protein
LHENVPDAPAHCAESEVAPHVECQDVSLIPEKDPVQAGAVDAAAAAGRIADAADAADAGDGPGCATANSASAAAQSPARVGIPRASMRFIAHDSFGGGRVELPQQRVRIYEHCL